jgi:hypothetical protein
MQSWLSCAACEETVFGLGDLPCGRRTESFTRCHVCHEPISWDPDDQKPQYDKRLGSYVRYGACRCGLTAWEWISDKNLWGYRYSASGKAVEPRRDDDADETPKMTPRAALGVIARSWGRRAVMGLGWVAGGIVVIALGFFLSADIEAFLASRPSWADLIWGGVIVLVFRNAVWPTLRRWRRRAARSTARREGQRGRALNAAWAVLRPPRPPSDANKPSDVEALRGP